MSVDIQQVTREVAAASAFVERLEAEVGKVVVGQKAMIERLLIGILANGHVLLEGVPGLAKTLTCKALSSAIQAKFSRVQFTPDLLPADVIGTLIYNQREQTFEPRLGPIFANIVLADEINRAPAKVQSALLEAMQERQVTIGDTTYPLNDPFLVLATQNPIEQEGTYPLPEAQVDRFLFKLKVTYPSRDEERRVLDRMGFSNSSSMAVDSIQPVLEPAQISEARAVVDRIYMDDKVKEYVLDLVQATRDPRKKGIKFHTPDANGRRSPMEKVVEVGGSPRATLSLALASRAHAFLRHRGHVTPDDVKAIAPDVLRHRILVTYEAEAEQMTSDDVVRQIVDQVEVP
ncbi:MAG: MoxR family ATPase [Candidatus Sumerlaeia bacterium]|nr:MoxR family ATPase [Candidatus Sumerlaeia bacterium]